MKCSHLAAVGGDDSQISRDPVSTFNLHQITNHHLFGIDVLLLAITDDQGLLQDETRKRQTEEKVRLVAFFSLYLSCVYFHILQKKALSSW